MNSIKMRGVFFICFCSIVPLSATAGDSLLVACQNIGGQLKTGKFIDNVNIKDSTTAAGPKSNIVQILYDDQWYEVSGSAATSILMTADMAILLHRLMDVCVDVTVGHEKIMGMEFGLTLR